MTNGGILQKLIGFVAQTSYEDHSDNPITLASGNKSKHYVDCKKALSHAEARAWIGEAILEVADANRLQFKGVGGLELGAYPIGTAVSDAAFRKDKRKLNAFVVRKQRKAHGLKSLVEGDLTGVKRVLIVDDVVTSGSSVITAIRACRDDNFEVMGAVAIVDREEMGGRQNIEAENVMFWPLMTLKDLAHVNESELVVHS